MCGHINYFLCNLFNFGQFVFVSNAEPRVEADDNIHPGSFAAYRRSENIIRLLLFVLHQGELKYDDYQLILNWTESLKVPAVRILYFCQGTRGVSADHGKDMALNL